MNTVDKYDLNPSEAQLVSYLDFVNSKPSTFMPFTIVGDKPCKPDTREMVEVSMWVPIDEIDFSACQCERDELQHEFGEENIFSTDLCGATYRGEEVTFTDWDKAEEYLQELRFGS